MSSAAGWMVLGAWWFALMALGIKVAAASYSTFEVVFYRGLVSLVMMAMVVRLRGTSLRTSVPWMHVWRALAGVVSLSTWFYCIGHLPLATAMTLNYMSGVWLAAFVLGGSLLVGRVQRQGGLLMAVLLGFVGVVMVLRPTLDQEQLFAGLIGVLSGMCAAMAYLQITALGRVGEPEERTVFYFAMSTTVVGALGMSVTTFTPWTHVPWQHTVWLLPIGVFASLGQWCLTRAYRDGASLVVACMQYSGIVFATLLGAFWFDDSITPLGWAGMTVIVASGVLATILRGRVLPDVPVQER